METDLDIESLTHMFRTGPLKDAVLVLVHDDSMFVKRLFNTHRWLQCDFKIHFTKDSLRLGSMSHNQHTYMETEVPKTNFVWFNPYQTSVSFKVQYHAKKGVLANIFKRYPKSKIAVAYTSSSVVFVFYTDDGLRDTHVMKCDMASNLLVEYPTDANAHETTIDSEDMDHVIRHFRVMGCNSLLVRVAPEHSLLIQPADGQHLGGEIRSNDCRTVHRLGVDNKRDWNKATAYSHTFSLTPIMVRALRHAKCVTDELVFVCGANPLLIVKGFINGAASGMIMILYRE